MLTLVNVLGVLLEYVTILLGGVVVRDGGGGVLDIDCRFLFSRPFAIVYEKLA